MPLIYKPRDPNYGKKRVLKRNVIRRKSIYASVLPDTKAYIESMQGKISPGHLIDRAIELYANYRHDEPSVITTESAKLAVLKTTVSQSTLAYIRFMRSAMSPGELIDAAIRLFKDANSS